MGARGGRAADGVGAVKGLRTPAAVVSAVGVVIGGGNGGVGGGLRDECVFDAFVSLHVLAERGTAYLALLAARGAGR